MTRRLLIGTLGATVAGVLFAHGGAEHVTGFVKAMDADSVTVETLKHEMVKVMLTPKTEVMKAKAKAGIQDLRVGDRVVIHAMKNTDGKLEAHEVAIGGAPAATAAAH